MAKDLLACIEELCTPTEIDEFITELNSHEYESLIAIAKTYLVFETKESLREKRMSHCNTFYKDIVMKMDYIIKSIPYYDGGEKIYTVGKGHNPEYHCNYDLDKLPSNNSDDYEQEYFEWRKVYNVYY